MRVRRLVVPIAVVVVATAIILIGSSIALRNRPEPGVATAPPGPVISEPTSTRVVDEQGRVVYDFGATVIRIPEQDNPTSTTSQGYTSNVLVSLCWPRPPETGECPGISNVVRIFLRGATDRDVLRAAASYVYEDSLAQLKKEVSVAVGPADTSIPGVWGFSPVDTDANFYYALAQPDWQGRHIVASCYYGPTCRAWASVAPGLTARYTFDTSQLPRWPELNQHVREYVLRYLED